MHEISNGDTGLARQLMDVACDPTLRQAVYEQLGEYCHQCRNRLNSLKLSLYLVKRQNPASPSIDRWIELERCYQGLERRVDRLQSICRPMTLSRIKLGLDLLFEDRRESWSRLLASEGRELLLIAPRERAVASFDVERLGQALDSLMSWRAGGFDSSGPIQVRWWVDANQAYLSWEEEDSRRRETSIGGENAWPLPILARVINAHDGRLVENNDRGWRLRLSWPTAP